MRASQLDDDAGEELVKNFLQKIDTEFKAGNYDNDNINDISTLWYLYRVFLSKRPKDKKLIALKQTVCKPKNLPTSLFDNNKRKRKKVRCIISGTKYKKTSY